MDPDRLAELEEERRFLLRSLDDLEREFEAGDIDEVDYRELRDGYTVRAAAALRAIDAGRAALPPRPAPDWPRRAGVAALTALLIGVVWWALAASSAQRLPGQEVTGLDPRDDRSVLLAQARSLQLAQPAVAADLYGQVLELEPDDVEALAYRGWTLALSTRLLDDPAAVDETLSEAVSSLARAIELDPEYPDPYCFVGVIEVRFRDEPESGAQFLERCLAANPPADIRGLVEPLLAEARGAG